MSRPLYRSSVECDEVAAGLQLFLDHIPQRETDIYGCIQELLQISAELKELELEFVELQADIPDFHQVFARPIKDVHLNLRSLQYNLRNVRRMFGETRQEKYSGARPYRRAWEDLDIHLTMKEGGYSLLPRLETSNIFLHNVLSSLRGEEIDTDEIVRDRLRLTQTLSRQEALEQAFAGMSFNESPGFARRPPLSPLRTANYPPSRSNWSDESDAMPRPPAPEPPNPWSPLSPTLSNSSGGTFASAQTWTSNSSASRSQISHWAVKVFDGKHGTSKFKTPAEPTVCYGRPDSPGCLDRLAAESFLEVLRLPLEGKKYYTKLYWRPADHRARILLTTKDTSGIPIHYSIPLTAIKLTRKGPTLLLWRVDRETEEFILWARLSFTVYEQMVLFYCAFTAMKSQDWTKFPDKLCDKFHKRERSEEKEEFSGEIKDDNYLHALRIYVDKDSGGIRLEARARRGQFTTTPIWTAFITDKVDSGTWTRQLNSKVIQLSALHPYVFCHSYIPPRGKTGKFQLQFTKSQDAAAFLDMVNDLARS